MIRNSSKAIVLNEGKVLLIKLSNIGNTYYILPGGGQDQYETLHEALKRECLEETGYHIDVRDIMFVRDYIARNHEFAKSSPEFHQVEFMFDCRLDMTKEKEESSLLDRNQVGVEWISLSSLSSINLYPKVLKEKIKQFYDGKEMPIYLGDIN